MNKVFLLSALIFGACASTPPPVGACEERAAKLKSERDAARETLQKALRLMDRKDKNAQAEAELRRVLEGRDK